MNHRDLIDVPPRALSLLRTLRHQGSEPSRPATKLDTSDQARSALAVSVQAQILSLLEDVISAMASRCRSSPKTLQW